MVLKILSNIKGNPSKISKYGNLNFDKINQKLLNCKPALQLLFVAGFSVENSEDTARLIWSNSKENMEQISNILQILSMNDDQLHTFISLINTEYTIEEAILAINLSNED